MEGGSGGSCAWTCGPYSATTQIAAIARSIDLAHPRSWRDLSVKRHERWLSTFGARSQNHAVRFDTHQLRWFQIEHDRDRPADQLFRCVGFRDAGDNRPLLSAD